LIDKLVILSIIEFLSIDGPVMTPSATIGFILVDCWVDPISTNGVLFFPMTSSLPQYCFSLFLSQLEESTTRQFEKIAREDKLNLAKNLVVEPLIPKNFVET
jgi:hypothetical protein